MTKSRTTVQDADMGASRKVYRRFLLHPLLPAVIVGLLWIGCASDPAQGVSEAGITGTSTALSICSEPSLANAEDLISDFDEGFGRVNQTAPNRGGGFYSFDDKTGTHVPTAGASDPPAEPTGCGESNPYMFCTSGKGFTDWGSGIATDVGITDGSGSKKPYNTTAAGYTGISFWAKSRLANSCPVLVKFPNKDTGEDGKLCNTGVKSGPEACYDDFGKVVTITGPDWQVYTIKFSELTQKGFGRRADSFDATTLFAIQFQVDFSVPEYNYCIDNFKFIRD
jgi:hypothetical protein